MKCVANVASPAANIRPEIGFEVETLVPALSVMVGLTATERVGPSICPVRQGRRAAALVVLQLEKCSPRLSVSVSVPLPGLTITTSVLSSNARISRPAYLNGSVTVSSPVQRFSPIGIE